MARKIDRKMNKDGMKAHWKDVKKDGKKEIWK